MTFPGFTSTPDGNGWQEWEPIAEGDLISSMHIEPATRHLHFKWSFWEFENPLSTWCLVNPLDYLTPSPMQGTEYTWTFNPSGYTPTYEFFFGDQREPEAWPASPALVVQDPNFLKDENNLSGAVDVFFGFGLSGTGQTTTAECGRNDLAPEKIKWDIQQVTVTGLNLLVEKYLVNFNCPLDNQENIKPKLLYFKWDLDELRNIFTYIPPTTPQIDYDHEGLIVCLSNCGDDQGWENLGIDNIEENC